MSIAVFLLSLVFDVQFVRKSRRRLLLFTSSVHSRQRGTFDGWLRDMGLAIACRHQWEGRGAVVVVAWG